MKLESVKILEKVCEVYKLSIDNIKSNSRIGEVVKARQIYSYLSMNYTNDKIDYIAALINRDRTTVLHSVNKINSEMYIYKDLLDEINYIKDKLIVNKLVVQDVNLLDLSKNYTNSFL